MRYLTAVFLAVSLSSQALAADAVGTKKSWGTVDVTLQKYAFQGSAVATALLLKNNTEKPENISSIMQFQMLSNEGDKGDLQLNGKCDGTIPPMAVMKCILTYSFPSSPTEVSLQVGAGLEGDPIYFNLAK